MPGQARARRACCLSVALGLAGLGACGLDSGVHPQPDEASAGDGADVGSVVSAGGFGEWDASTTPLGAGDDGGQGPAGSSGMHGGGIGSGATASGGIGGATSTGGAAGAGGLGEGAANEGGGDAGTPPPPLPHALYFSEYVEGSGTNKALELAARERSSLNGCVIQTYFNGRSDVGASALLAGELAPPAVWTLCTSALASNLGAVCKQTANLTFNGNDTLVLACDGVMLDVIGQLGFDPGTYWGSADIRTADRTLRRACAISQGDTTPDDAFEPSIEWLAAPSDSFDGLGSRGCDATPDAGLDAASDASADAGSDAAP